MIEDTITAILKAEGWDKYTNHPADRGGPTKWGITLRAWSDYLDRPLFADDIKAITEIEARTFYEQKYLREPQFDQLPHSLRELVVDSGVHSGPRRAAKWVQRACGAVQDGRIGPKTITAVWNTPPNVAYLRIIGYRLALFGRLVSRDPQLKAARKAGFRLQAEFAAGWVNRGVSFIQTLAEDLNDS